MNISSYRAPFTLVLVLFFLYPSVGYCQSQNLAEGRVIHTRLHSNSISGNQGGEDPVRRLSIYLPPGYDDANERYPVIYYLHGFTWNDSLTFVSDGMHHLLDKAINQGILRNTIVVVPNQYTLFKGSFLTNSSLTGNWVDFTTSEVVDYMDENYRTIPHRNSRGIAGHSMGGNGALKLGMLRADVFGAVYGLSPAVLGWADDFSLTNKAFKLAQTASTREELFEDFWATVFIAMCRAYSPEVDNDPFQCDLPVVYEGDDMHTKPEVVAEWDEQLPTTMIAEHLKELESLNALKLDWGRNEQFAHIPLTAIEFSKELESFGIEHYAEEYIGTHTNKLWTPDGRIYNDMLPFFNRFLEFE